MSMKERVKTLFIISIAIFVVACDSKHDLENYLKSNPIWINKDINWTSPPKEIDPASLYSEDGKLLVFSNNGQFKILEYTFYKSDSSDYINLGGEGGNLYLGSWQEIEKNKIKIKYRLVDKVIHFEGKKIPGDEISDYINVETKSEYPRIEFLNQIFIPCSNVNAKSKSLLLSN